MRVCSAEECPGCWTCVRSLEDAGEVVMSVAVHHLPHPCLRECVGMCPGGRAPATELELAVATRRRACARACVNACVREIGCSAACSWEDVS